MRYFEKIMLFAATAVLLLLGSCAKEATEALNDVENRSLKAWMLKNRPALVENFQPDGKYYVEVLEAGEPDSVAIHDIIADEKLGDCWLFFDVTGRSLHGDVCLTRSEPVARMQGTFSKSTHYVPFLRYVGKENVSLMEGSYLAMKNVLTLGEAYAAEKGLSTNFTMRCGTKLRLYLPSAVVNGAAGTSETGGYEGQYALDGNIPMIMDVEIVNRVNNPLAYEGEMVEGFGAGNGGVTPVPEKGSGKNGLKALRRSLTESTRDNSGNVWRHAQDTIPGIIVNETYVPDATKPFDYAFQFVKNKTDEQTTYAKNNPYTDNDVYAGGPSELDKKMNAALLERFGSGDASGEKVGENGTARVWYIGRFLDGFIFDTNIDEVKKLIYGTVESKGASLGYSVSSSKDDYITAWYYTIPELRYGNWATFVTTSSFAYGVTGLSGTSNTTTSSSSSISDYYNYMNYYNYYNYYNMYYGNAYYNNYYMNYYNYSNMFGGATSDSDTVTKTTVTTEIQAYTPLIFQIFIEKKSDVTSD